MAIAASLPADQKACADFAHPDSLPTNLPNQHHS